MALSKTDGQHSFTGDIQQQRIGQGTVTAQHVQPAGLNANNFKNVIDDADPLIQYGSFNGDVVVFDHTGSYELESGTTFTCLGGLSSMGTPGAAAVYRFNGTAIGVLAQTSPNSGIMQVYIDGVLTSGRLAVTATLDSEGIAIGATEFRAFGGLTSFNASGQLFVGSEVLTYSSHSGNTFYLASPATQAHYPNETVYAWGSAIDLSTTTDVGHRRLVYYTPLLEPGDHRIAIVAQAASNGIARIFFDGFVVGSLMGTKNVFTQTGTITRNITTDANGHGDIGGSVANTADILPLAILGYTDPLCEVTNTRLLGRIGIKYQPDGSMFLYYHNGPPSTTVTLIITYTYLGESV